MKNLKKIERKELKTIW